MNLPKVICIDLAWKMRGNGGNSRVACELSSTGGKHRDNVLRMITIDRKYYFRIENVH